MTNPDVAHKLERFFDAVFSATNMEHKHLAIEGKLMTLKWYGYRFLTPLAATKMFFETYRDQLVRYLEVHKDKDLAAATPEIGFDDYIKNPENLTKTWTARQRADVSGIPYDLYVEFCMDFWSRRSWGGRRFAPQINQLSYSPRSEIAWRIMFDKFKLDRLDDAARSLSMVPQLHPAQFRDTPEQTAAREFILQRCGESTRSWADSIELWCHTYPVLTLDSFASVVDANVLDAAVKQVAAVKRDPPVVPAPLLAGALWPSCHGMPGAQVPAEPACIQCKFAGSCGKFAVMVVDQVKRSTGQEQPRKAQLRAPKNARQAALRARKKGTGGSGAPPNASFSAVSTPPEVLAS